jgi:hypothetical protein
MIKENKDRFFPPDHNNNSRPYIGIKASVYLISLKYFSMFLKSEWNPCVA